MLKLITNANLFSPEAMGICHLLIAGQTIVYIGSHLPVLDKALQVEVTDLKGASLVPGFIDGHAHITGGGGETGPASRVPPVFLSQFTAFGVTSVVGVLGTDDLTRNTQSLVTQAYGLREEGMSAWCHTGGYHLPLTTLTDSARGDIVFIDPVIGVGELAISDHRSSQPTLSEFLRVASEAHVAGLMTGKAGILHIHMGDGKRGLELVREALDTCEIPARVFNPTHINRNKTLFDEALPLSLEGVRLDVTAFPEGHSAPGWSAAEAFLRYRDGGYPADKLTISSDGGGCLPHFNAEGEPESMGIGCASTLVKTLAEVLNNHVPMEEALLPFTSNVADLLKLSQKGRLVQGKDADMVVLDQQHNITDVMARGRWHKRSGEMQILGTYETP
ncbi:beta-aspartyl-peptidase [Oceanospirillaceae bacterium]|nr:beta-aspartyl-peptidase [Oceanospirillaceae bacterium]